MNFKFKRTISVILTLMLMLGCCIPAFAGDVNGTVDLSVSCNSSYKWGDDIVFTVTIANNTDKRINNVNLVAEAKGVNKYFSKSDDSIGTIEYITPGATRTVDLILKTKKISSIESFFRSISTFFKNLFSKFSRSYSYTKKIKVGMSNITFGISADYEVSEQNNNGGVNLDDPEPDVEIYSFATDTYDILIGETQEVTFTSEIFANIELEDDAVKVVDVDSNIVGIMNDKGMYGDEEENDGIYTLGVSLSSDEVCTKAYRSTVNGCYSEEVVVGFYKHYSDAELDEMTQIVESATEIAGKYTDAEGNIIEGKLHLAMNELSSKMEEFKNRNIVKSYTVDGMDFKVELVNGMTYSYSFGLANTDNVGTMVSVQPYKFDENNPYSSEMQALSDAATDGSARRVSGEFEDYTFNSATSGNNLNTSNDGNYDRHEVTLDNLQVIINEEVVSWHGHGGYDSDVGSFMCTGEMYTEDIYSAYEQDISAGRIYLSGDRFLITGGFIQKYAGDLSGHLFYMGTCSSAKDMEDGRSNQWELAQEFVNKGAVVVGNTDTIYTRYNTRMEAAIYEYLCQQDADGNYHTLEEALSYARDLYGDNDGHPSDAARVEIYPNTNAAHNYRLHETEKGNIAGVIKNAANSYTISNALIRAYKNGDLIASTRTNGSGSYNLELPAGEYIVKISAGGFKTTKMAVTVRPDATTYNETFLLIFAGVNEGYANGNTKNAITGQLLPDVQINIRNGWNNEEGEIVKTITSNGNGYYEVELPAGWYTFECYKDGFITTYKNILVFVYDFMSQDISVAPELGEGYYRVVLTWGQDPSDLDSHLFGSTPDYSYRVYYGDKNGYDDEGNIVANLDVDDTTSFGPETTTFLIEENGKYDFYIDWFSGSGTWASSGGKVEVYNGAYLINTYFVPSVSNRNGSWKVFSIENGVYTSYNIIQSQDIY